MKKFIPALVLASAMPVVLPGCLVMTPVNAEPPLTAEQIMNEEADRTLAEAVALYEKGYYDNAEARLLDETLWQGSWQTQAEASKYLAFIYCITEREQLCRHAFERAMHLDLSFTLSTAEASHPLWGPQY